MKKYYLIPALLAFIVALSGCTAGTVSTSVEPLPSDDGAKELTIEVWDVSGFYQSAALKFESETGIDVHLKNTYKPGPSFQDDYAANEERIQAELMAGKGADVYAGIYLNFTDIGKNKHLCRLADWIAADPVFSNDAYYMNVLTSGFKKGNVYSAPLFIMFNALGSPMEVPALDGKELNWEAFFNLTKDTKRNGVLYGIDDYALFRRRFGESYARFIDEENKTQNLNSPELIDLLKQCKQWSAEGLCIPFNAENYTEMFDNAFFIEYGGGDMDMLTNFRFDNPYLSDEPYYYDIPSDSGKNDKANKIAPSDYICINAASPSKGTAWRFVKFLLSEEIQATGFFTPVNREAAAEHVRKNLNELVDYFKLDTDANQVIEDSKTILDTVSEVSSHTDPTEIEQIVFNKNAKRYFNNEISAEEAAKSMAAGVELYFKEQ